MWMMCVCIAKRTDLNSFHLLHYCYCYSHMRRQEVEADEGLTLPLILRDRRRKFMGF